MVQIFKVGCHFVDKFLTQVILGAIVSKVHLLLTLTQSQHVLADNYTRLVNGKSQTAVTVWELAVLYQHIQDLPTARINLSPFTKDFRVSGSYWNYIQFICRLSLREPT